MNSSFAGSTYAPGHFVSVDTETTGINPERDVVIEIAVVVFNREDIVERYSQTIDPGRKLPLDIIRLTGIIDADLVGSPRIADVRAIVRQKLGAMPIVAHNVDFDVAMLEKSGIPVPNRRFDTYRLATLLLPNLAGYSLTAVADALDVVVDVEHRALADALRSARVFQALLNRIDDYDERTLNQTAAFAQQAGWPEAELFRAAADKALSGPLFGTADGGRELLPELKFMEPREMPKPLQRTGSQASIHIEGMLDLLSPEGSLSHVLERFESRPTQVRMAGAVGRSLNDDQELLVEAGTGTGKSLAYLLPAAVFALDRGERVVVSTNTLALQDQLYRKDLPDLRAALREHGILEDLRVAVMKGRANYLCLTRWFEHLNEPVEDPADAALRAKILLWLPHTETGDKAELRLTREEERHWRSFASEKGRCTPKRCAYARNGQCFLYRARSNAANAHLVIANHSLVLSNSAQGFVLPVFERLIVDEAHHLEEEATSQFSWSADRGEIEEPLRLLAHTDGQTGGLFDLTSAFFLRAGDISAAREATEAQERSSKASGSVLTLNTLATELFTRLGSLLPPSKGGRQSFSDQLRLTETVRYRGQWAEIAMIWSQLDRELMEVLDSGRWYLRILDTMTLPDDELNPNTVMRDDLTIDLQNALEPLATIRKQLLNAFASDDGSNVYWIERSAIQGNISLNGAPLDVSMLLRTDVFNDLKSCVLTSATLTIDGSFDYIAERLGLEDSVRLMLGSPFDHERSTMVYVPDDMPDPKHPQFQDALNESLIELLRSSGGRALVLFTSHAALRSTLNAIKGPLARENISVLGQGVDGSFRQLVDRLKSNPGTAILGTSSYWEGVDVVGPALSVVAIVKLPFPVPSDPVFEARCELSSDPFNELSVPKAVLRFKQGFGRLIRSDRDRGVCVVYDRRIISRRYGQSFLHSLPQCTVSVRSLYDLPDSTHRWLDEDASGRKDPLLMGGYR